MKGYLISVASAVIFAAVTDILIPKNMQKYVSMLTGAIILISIISPIAKLTKTELPTLNIPEIEYNEYEIYDSALYEFKKNVEKDITIRLQSEFGINADAAVNVKTEDGKISGISRIQLSCKRDDKLTDRFSYIYGCNNIVFSDGG